MFKKFIQFLLFAIVVCSYDVREFGAVPKIDSLQNHFKNQDALQKAILAANSSNTQRIVKVPNMTFYAMPVRLLNIYNVTLQIAGKWSASTNVKLWPTQPYSDLFQDFIYFGNSKFITIRGPGTIDGRGYHWWMICTLDIKQLLPHQYDRPHLIRMQKVINISIYDITLKNSPQFHLKMDQCYDAELYNINIKVNTTAQLHLLKKRSLLGILPIFPLNTDGIDPHGARMKIYNLVTQNFDDVVVPKPGRIGDLGANCTEDMMVYNITAKFGVGITIGSVPPNINHNCIRNITFKDVTIKRPIKGIYVKTNPGDVGSGIVQNIWYQNITMDRPIWWAIYIGPQQMLQPDGDGPGCMFYPFDPKGHCHTNPRVPFRNITLKDVSIHKPLLFPVIIRCNETNPCHDINFYNVKTDKWRIGKKHKGFVCEYAYGQFINNHPQIKCITNQTKLDQQVQQLTSQNQFVEYFSKELLEQLSRAVEQIPYEEQDDEFDYEFLRRELSINLLDQ